MAVSRNYSCIVFIVNLGGLEQKVKVCWSDCSSVAYGGSKVWLLGTACGCSLLLSCPHQHHCWQWGGEGPCCPVPLQSVSRSDQAQQQELDQPTPGIKVLFIRLLPDGQKLLIKVFFYFHPCKWLSKSANRHGINVICIVVCELVCFVGSF